jgi:hypothetical protein
VLLILAISPIWLLITLSQITNHELWRDEVMALSYALEPSSIFSLVTDPPRDGHPILWTLMLRFAHDLVETNAVLPILGYVSAASAVLAFCAYAPFGWPILILVPFSAFAATEYAVLSRNYAISMLLMVVLAKLYTSTTQRPLLLAATLVLLANTNIHSLFFAAILAALWIADAFRPELTAPATSKKWLFIAAAIVAVGFAFSAFTIYPSVHDVYRPAPSLASAAGAVLLPGYYLQAGFIFPEVTAVMGWKMAWAAGTILMFLAVFGLSMRPRLMVAAALAVFGLSIFSSIVYSLQYRHVGLLIVFLLLMYWLYLRAEDEITPDSLSASFKLGIGLALPLILLFQVVATPSRAWNEIFRPYSASEELAALIKSRPDLHDAVIMGSPDYVISALPYYFDNKLYLPQERRYGKSPIFSKKSAGLMQLKQLAEQGRVISAETGQRVVVLMGPNLEPEHSGEIFEYREGRSFAFTREELAEFRDRFDLIASFRGTLEVSEGYDVYVTKQ